MAKPSVFLWMWHERQLSRIDDPASTAFRLTLAWNCKALRPIVIDGQFFTDANIVRCVEENAEVFGIAFVAGKINEVEIAIGRA